ncbi:MAG: type II toxin-antitoxin system VapB family antitoxin [Candidatus Rokuibacteriota bacterium]
MKTTVEIPDSLLEEARKLAAREGTTVRALIEAGLRHVVAERRRPTAFRLRRATFAGDGLRPEVAGAGWDRLRELAYEDRGA